MIAATAFTAYFCFDFLGWQSLTVTTTTSVSFHATTPSTRIPPHIIDLARQRARQFNATQAIEDVRILATGHPAFRNIPAEFQPSAEAKKWHFPDVNIAGLQKAGSSQLFHVLTTHQNMTRYHQRLKEFNFGIPHLSLNISNLLFEDSVAANKTMRQERLSSLQRFFHDRTTQKPLNF